MPGSPEHLRTLLEDALLKIRALRGELAALHEPIAVVGAAARFPGAPDLDAYWRLLAGGVDAIGPIPDTRWRSADLYDPDPDRPGTSYVREGGFIDGIEGFDAEFFGISPREAAEIDPQQRLLLEVSWEALEHAGLAPDRLRGTRTGVWTGMMSPEYAFRRQRGLEAHDVSAYMPSGNELSFGAGRVAYFLGLQGPAMVIASACSSSLVTVHLACQALRAGECDAALAGGVNLMIDPFTNVMLSKLRALARDGRCKTFDAAADGYGRGEGAGMVVLKRLSAARANGDRIMAVIHGSAVNHDGASAGLTVPNGTAQEALLRQALAASRLDARELGYVEAHGTGTMLGDPIELHALARVRGADKGAPLIVGSVKTNIGHLEPAAGIAGLIKTVLAVEHREIPRHLHFQTPNPHVRWDDLPLRVAREAMAFPAAGGRRIAGVSSFGLSGVNAHVIVGDADGDGDAGAGRDEDGLPHVLTLSARTPGALRELSERYQRFLAGAPRAHWADMCFTANTGRAHFPHRLAIVAASAREGLEALRAATVSAAPVRPAGDAARAPGETRDASVTRLAAAYAAGATVDWASLDPAAPRRRVSLPTYPFQRTRQWALTAEAPAAAAPGSPAAFGAPSRLDPDFVSRIRSASNEERRELLLPAIEAHAMRVLGLDTPPRRDEPLLDAGLDSLMAVELKAWAECELGVELELGTLLSGASLAGIVDAAAAAIAPDAAADERRAAPATRFPLSAGQQALWFIHRQAPQSHAYNVGVALAIAEPIDASALARAFDAAVERHAMLRARVTVDAGVPMLEVLEKDAPFETIDARGWTTGVLDARLADAQRRPFDLERGLMRVRLFERGDAGSVLLVTIHHIACDALSCWTLLEDVQSLYRATRAGGRPAVTPPARAYADFVAWQREWIDGPRGARSWAYWRATLAGSLPPLELQADHPRPALQTYNGGSAQFVVPAALSRALRALAHDEHATLFAALLAAFTALLHRLTGQTDVIVGTATLGRPAAFQDVVGNFANPVAIRASLSDDPSFRALLARVRRAAVDAIEHSDFPFPLLVERLQPPRDPGRAPVFQVDFSLSKPAASYRPALKQKAGADRLALSRYPLPEEEGQFDLGLHVTDEDGELHATLKYNTDLFLPATIERLGAMLVSVLGHVTTHPDERVAAIPLVDEQRRRALLDLGRGPRADIRDDTFPQLFEAAAARTPDAVAAECDGACLTYAEINERASQLAAHLGGLGVGPDSLVAICLDRTPELVVAILGVHKAGGAFVPLDPDAPPDRLRWIADDAGARVVLTTTAVAAAVSAIDATLVRLDTDWPAIARAGALAGSVAAAPHHLAYVMYTSGSTGRPKGVEIEHRQLTNYLVWARDAYAADSGIGAAVSTSIGFDATITSLLLPLTCGGRVVLVPSAGAIETLARLITARRDFSLLKLTPAHLEMLEHLIGDADCAGGARAFVIGGEALAGERLRYWQARCPDTRFINEYGPTETVVGCSAHEVMAPIQGAVPIGRPIANTSLYVLDAAGAPVPRGVVGELYIGGAGVGRGYRNRPDLTAERFLGDPFADDPDARMYRSGDLARWRADGVLEFVGRVDGQIKIRGYRIEPGEIEGALVRHPAVSAAAVTLDRQRPDDPRLVAYIVSRDGVDVPAAELLRRLAADLPPYMLPSAIVPLPALPLTTHGKVDYRSLPAPEPAAVTAGFVPPRDTLEMQIAAEWEEVLGVRPIGVRDNFFDIGGHSLLAVRLMSRLETLAGRELPLATILRGPTIEQLASALRALRTAPERSALVPIQPNGTHAPFFCVPGAGGNAIYLYHLARQLGPDQPFFGFQGVGFDGEAPPDTTVEQMAGHYLDALRAVQPRGPYRLGGHSLGGWVAYEMAQRLIAAGEQVAVLAVIDTAAPSSGRPFDTSGWTDGRWIFELGDRIKHLLNPEMTLSLDDLEALGAEAQLRHFKDALSAADLYPGDADIRHLKHVLTLFKAHLGVRYTLPAHTHPVRVALLRTDTAPEHAVVPPQDPTWGWGAVADVDVHAVPGDHFAVLRPPHVRVLAQALAGCLAQAG